MVHLVMVVPDEAQRPAAQALLASCSQGRDPDLDLSTDVVVSRGGGASLGVLVLNPTAGASAVEAQ